MSNETPSCLLSDSVEPDKVSVSWEAPGNGFSGSGIASRIYPGEDCRILRDKGLTRLGHLGNGVCEPGVGPLVRLRSFLWLCNRVGIPQLVDHITHSTRSGASGIRVLESRPPQYISSISNLDTTNNGKTVARPSAQAVNPNHPFITTYCDLDTWSQEALQTSSREMRCTTVLQTVS